MPSPAFCLFARILVKRTGFCKIPDNASPILRIWPPPSPEELRTVRSQITFSTIKEKKAFFVVSRLNGYPQKLIRFWFIGLLVWFCFLTGLQFLRIFPCRFSFCSWLGVYISLASFALCFLVFVSVLPVSLGWIHLVTWEKWPDNELTVNQRLFFWFLPHFSHEPFWGKNPGKPLAMQPVPSLKQRKEVQRILRCRRTAKASEETHITWFNPFSVLQIDIQNQNWGRFSSLSLTNLSEQEITVQYRQIAVQIHPDKNPGLCRFGWVDRLQISMLPQPSQFSTQLTIWWKVCSFVFLLFTAPDRSKIGSDFL